VLATCIIFNRRIKPFYCYMKKIIAFVKRRKVLVLFLSAILIAGGFLLFKNINNEESAVTYSFSKVEQGNLISTVTGTGQVSSLNQVNITSNIAGRIVALDLKAGQMVTEGDLLFQVDASDAIRNLNEAIASLKNEELKLEELMTPVDTLTLLQTENDLIDAQDNLVQLKVSQKNDYQNTLEDQETAKNDLVKAYEDAHSDISDAFLDFPNIMSGVYSVLYGKEIAEDELAINDYMENKSSLLNGVDVEDRYLFENSYIDKAIDNYNLAKGSYDEDFEDYRGVDRYSEDELIEEMLNNSYDTAKKIANVIKDETNTIDWWIEHRTVKDRRIYSEVNNFSLDLSSYTSSINFHLSGLLSAINNIEDKKETLENLADEIEEMKLSQPIELAAAERNLTEKEQKLIDLKEGSTELEIRSQELSVQQKRNSLSDAKQDYADCFVYAPFDGMVAEISYMTGDDVPSSASVITLITNQKIVEVSFNEIDMVEIKVGQKSNLTFDAIESLTVTGEVVEIAALGEVNSGVVSYDVKIYFDIQDERIKSGMSASVNIITSSDIDVLLVPINAVKTIGNQSYVEVLNEGRVEKKNVTIGSSNDTTIIVEGVEEGTKIISSYISSSTSSSPSKDSSIKSGNRSMMGGGMMIR